MMSQVNAKATSAAEATESLNDLTVVAARAPWLVANGLDTLDRLFEPSTGECLGKPGLNTWRERIRLTIQHDGDEQKLYLKRYRDPPAAARRELRRTGTGTRSLAALEWTRMRQLAQDGIACVEPVAFGEELVGGRERRSAILAKAVPGRSLESCAGDWTHTDRDRIRSVGRQVATIVAKLHGQGYIHRDLYLSHLFYDPSPDTADPVRLIDLQRILRNPRLIGRWVVKDLASLNYSVPAHLYSTADRLRWLKWYLDASKLDRSMKRLIHRIVGKTRRIARHDRRRLARFNPAGADAS
ncbi:MAG: hypothetical protein IH987_19595 [Planctomycetes bacterium]|nr:hypothetical protein [Planctomycetota bacterium]